MRYSLASHILSIEPNDASLSNTIKQVQVGGQGNALESITIDMDQDMWTTESFATGAYVHSKNLAKTGKITIRLSQLSEDTDKFKNLVNLHYQGDYKGLTVTLTNSMNDTGDGPNTICICKDCYFARIPTQEYGRTASMDSWVLTCGEISYS